MLTLHRLPRSYRVLYVGIAVLLAAALASHWLRLALRHGPTPSAIVAWYTGDESAMLFRKSGHEVADDAWLNLFHHTLAFLVLGGLIVRTSAAPAWKAGVAAMFGAGTLVSAAAPALVWWGVPGAATLYVAALATLTAGGLVVLGLVTRDAVSRRGEGHRGTAGSDVLAVMSTVALASVVLPQPLAGQALLTERQAIRKTFPAAAYAAVDTLRPDTAARAELERRLGRPLYEPEYVIRRLFSRDTTLLGYALVTEERGKYRPITMLVGADTAAAPRVVGVQILVYREPRGGEVSREFFLRQYRGKSTGDPIRLNRDIINISGATISVQSVSAGVRKTLALVERFYASPVRRPSSFIKIEELP